MKKMMLITVLAMLAAGALAETLTGTVFAKKGHWKIGKETKAGGRVAVANLNKADFEQAAALDGKTVEVSGELDPESRFPTFLPGAQIKVLAE